MAQDKSGGVVGIQTARFAILKDDGNIDTTFGDNGIYTVNTETDGGVTKASITGLAPSTTKVWGNDSMVDVSVGKAQPSVAFASNFLNHNILNKLLGRKALTDGSNTLESDPNQYVAMDIISTDVSGNDIHFGFYKGKLTQGDIDLATSNENQTRVQDALTFSAVVVNNTELGKPIIGKIASSADDSFKADDYYKDLFPSTSTIKPNVQSNVLTDE